MKGYWKVILLALGLPILLAGCSQAEATPTFTPMPLPPTATATAVPTLAPTPTFTPSLEPTFTQTPTPAPLTPAQIFDQISPAVAFVDNTRWFRQRRLDRRQLRFDQRPCRLAF
ncbi:MAG: hypothetical protein HND44_07190 [Chloroflexi bacterium]|nr:hypothetical protein [Ardenticatenaceae bacterium]NOG34346.1 hypothetical protein [Chloroflexota bacterium]GIK57348.1 MAG: hypothetical protein BroJett015_30110 [Chloroflexota bacterium]